MLNNFKKLLIQFNLLSLSSDKKMDTALSVCLQLVPHIVPHEIFYIKKSDDLATEKQVLSF